MEPKPRSACAVARAGAVIEIAKLEDPRVRGKSLTGNLAGVWRYRVGDYRILCDIDDGRRVRSWRARGLLEGLRAVLRALTDEDARLYLKARKSPQKRILGAFWG